MDSQSTDPFSNPFQLDGTGELDMDWHGGRTLSVSETSHFINNGGFIK